MFTVLLVTERWWKAEGEKEKERERDMERERERVRKREQRGRDREGKGGNRRWQGKEGREVERWGISTFGNYRGREKASDKTLSM